jgi:hypothetical protein
VAFSFFKKSPASQVEKRKPAQPASPGGPASRHSCAIEAGCAQQPAAERSAVGRLISLDFISRDPLEGARRMGKGELEVQDV